MLMIPGYAECPEDPLVAVGSILSYNFLSNGNTFNKWLGFANSETASNLLPLIAPQDLSLEELTFTNVDDDCDTDIQIYVNASLVFTWLVRNKRTAFKANPPLVTINQGDRISVFMARFLGGTGGDTSPQDPIVALVTKITSIQLTEGGTQFGV